MLGALFYFSFLAGITLLAVRKPHLALVAILCMFGLEQWGQIYVGFLRTNTAFTNIYILLLAAFAVFMSYKSGAFDFEINSERNRLRLLVIALFGYALISTVWTPQEALPLIRWQPIWPYLVLSILLAPLLLGRATELVETHRVFLFFGGALLFLLATVPEWGYRGLVVDGEVLRLPLALGQLSGYLLIIAAIYLERKPLNFALLAIVLISALVVVIRSGSRGQLLFSLVSLVAVAPLAWKRFSIAQAVYLIIGTVVISLAAYLVFGMLAADELSGRWAVEKMSSDIEGRLQRSFILLDNWSVSWTTIIFGLGNSASWSPNINGIYPHIVPLEILGEQGVLGFALFLAIVFYLLASGVRFYKFTHLPDAYKKAFAANFGCALFTLLLCLKQGSMITSSVFFLFLVLSEKHFFLASREEKRNARLAGIRRKIRYELLPTLKPAAN